MKKTLLLNFFVLCFASLVGAQEKSGGLTNELNRMINDGIKYKLLEYESWGYNTSLRNYYLLEDGLLQNFELSEFNKSRNVTILERRKFLQKIEEGTAFRLVGTELKGDTLSFRLVIGGVSKKRRWRYLHFETNGVLKLCYKYSCEEKKWNLVRGNNTHFEIDIEELKRYIDR
ncbi:hypothetical protein [Coprobacter tertius]|uniref:Uncharacterized protein n=1 Tax=Coprobacter tertius TaxID=2944915 RepID=A0ABT1MJX5_9BACT|nr:hypothetical protein [Coprobacter tertius]MCP9612910.1 hypothetical protein [Coprobacter tertius]